MRPEASSRNASLSMQEATSRMAQTSVGKDNPEIPSCSTAKCNPKQQTWAKSAAGTRRKRSLYDALCSFNASFSRFLSTLRQKMWQSSAAAWYNSPTSAVALRSSASSSSSYFFLLPFVAFSLLSFSFEPLSLLAGSFESFWSLVSFGALPLNIANSLDKHSALFAPSLATILSSTCFLLAAVTSMVSPLNSSQRKARSACKGSVTASRRRCCCNGDSCNPLASRARNPNASCS
mmetsp:Transcript_121752/g.344365  ORF Transcript_121752/g.344365 Transcript_121752/m.344365 type:complete len:234 (+) Transcript_121752:241-942(+)